MKYPTLNEIESTRQMVDTFSGYNHNLRINDGEFYDMENLSSSHYPVLSPRCKRGTYIEMTNHPQGMISKDSLCYVDGSYFVINNYRVDLKLSTEDDMCPKRLVSMGAYVIILPDEKWINTADLSEYGDINATYTNKDDVVPSVQLTMCGADGEAYEYDYIGADEPGGKDENGNNIAINSGAIWLDTSATPHSLKMYSSSSGMWVSIATTYIKIQATGIGKDFNLYDGVTISGLKNSKLKDFTTSAEIDGNLAKQIKDIDGSFVIWDKDDDWILIVGLIDSNVVLSNVITVKREMPKMDFVVESENRLWGCRYGTNKNGDVVNEIYASKQGDFKNWNCVMSVATDSYVASCGTDGQFTGAITHLGYPIFFKEGFMHKVYGNYPANYQIQTTACRGVQKGCHNSLAIVNEVLYYKSRSGIMAYDGSLPIEVSYSLGDVAYDNAVACGHGNKYYISMKNGDEYTLFVYDTKKTLWHKEDNTQVDEFCSCRGELYYIPHNVNAIKTMLGSGTKDTDTVKWMAETGVMSVSSPDKKYISRLNVRMSLDIGARVFFYIQYDSMGEWEHIASMAGTMLRTFTIPIRPKRCDHMRLRIVGDGDAKIYSITKTIEQGSDV